MKLISMTSFVLEQEKNYSHVTRDAKKNPFLLVVHYAKFLKQPLKPSMLFTCDDNENVIEEPRDYLFYTVGIAPTDEQVKECAEYDKAKEKVMFEGFMNIDTRKKGQIYFALKQSHRTNNIDHIMSDAFGLFFFDSNNEKFRINTVEHLLNFSDLQLTASALKQIGLNP